MFTAKSDALLSVQAPLLRYCTNRVSPAKTYLLVSLFYYAFIYEHATNTTCLRLRLTLRFRCKHLRFAITRIASPLPRSLSNRLLFLCFCNEHATNTFVFTAKSDALLSVQAPSLRYYTNRVSPAKKSIKLDFFFLLFLRTRNKHFRVYGCDNAIIRFISVVCPIR